MVAETVCLVAAVYGRAKLFFGMRYRIKNAMIQATSYWNKYLTGEAHQAIHKNKTAGQSKLDNESFLTTL